MLRMDDREFDVLTTYLQSQFGINLTKKRSLIESRMNNYLFQQGFDSYSSYFEYAFNDKSGQETSQLLNLLTTNFSYFMREWEHFQYFRDRVLPEMKQKIRDNDFRIWSAGCSTGQEPYTLAMIISDFKEQNGIHWDSKVLATDISLRALTVAQRGVYEEESLQNLPKIWRQSYFHKVQTDNWAINESLQKEVIFRRFNLMEEAFPFRKQFHVIFCRNVMIYFDTATRNKLVNKFYEMTCPGGYLFIGQSESLNRNDTKYKYLSPSVYQKQET